MKFIAAILLLSSVSAFAYETESCWGGPYWNLMDKSVRICNWKMQEFEAQYSVSCKIDNHNSPNVCYTSCYKADGVRHSKLRVDMTSNCDQGIVKFRKTKATFYR